MEWSTDARESKLSQARVVEASTSETLVSEIYSGCAAFSGRAHTQPEVLPTDILSSCTAFSGTAHTETQGSQNGDNDSMRTGNINDVIAQFGQLILEDGGQSNRQLTVEIGPAIIETPSSPQIQVEIGPAVIETPQTRQHPTRGSADAIRQAELAAQRAQREARQALERLGQLLQQDRQRLQAALQRGS